MKYSIERAEIRNHENERDRYYQVIDETIYRGPFAFNVRALSPCSLSMSTTSEEERLPRASLSRPNRLRFLSPVRLTRFRSQTRGPSTTRFLLIYAYACRQQATHS